MPINSADEPRRVIAPTFPYVPDGIYADPHVQAWADYYASGGRDLAGTTYFNTPIPGLTDIEQTVEPETVVSDRARTPSTSSGLSRRPTLPPASPPQTRNTSAETVPIRTRKLSRAKSTRKNILGLLETLHLRRRKDSAPDFEIDGNASPTVRRTTSVRFQDDEPPTPFIPYVEREYASDNSSTRAVYTNDVSDSDPEDIIPLSEFSNNSDKPPAYDVHGFGTTSPSPPRWPSLDGKVEQASGNGVEPQTQAEVTSEDTDVVIPTPDLVSEQHSPETTTLSGTIIYQSLITHLGAHVAPESSASDMLWAYTTHLSSLDALSSLICSHEYRSKLLQIASTLGISDGAEIRRALQNDEAELAHVLHSLSCSDLGRQEVLRLEGEDAQHFLDVVQDVLDRGFLLEQDEGVRARRLLVKLSETCDKLPSSLFIKGVENVDMHSTFGGGFGDIYRAKYQGKLIALKRMRIFTRDPSVAAMRKRFCREALLWQHFNSPYILPFLGIDAETFPSFLCLVSPWMRHGTILRHLAENGRTNVVKRLYEIIQGLSYLHRQNFVHGDLRGSNILINDKWEACLTDFGLTVFHDATAQTFTSRHEGSIRWMAPELHFPQSFGLSRFRLTPESDVYSFACVCLELYTGRAPFSETAHDPAVMLKVVRGERPERPPGASSMSDELWELVGKSWSHQPGERLKTIQLVDMMQELASKHGSPIQESPNTTHLSSSEVQDLEDAPTVTLSSFQQHLAAHLHPTFLYENVAEQTEYHFPGSSQGFSRTANVPGADADDDSEDGSESPLLSRVSSFSIRAVRPRDENGQESTNLSSSPSLGALLSPRRETVTQEVGFTSSEKVPSSDTEGDIGESALSPDLLQQVESAFGSNFVLDDFSLTLFNKRHSASSTVSGRSHELPEPPIAASEKVPLPAVHQQEQEQRHLDVRVTITLPNLKDVEKVIPFAFLPLLLVILYAYLSL